MQLADLTPLVTSLVLPPGGPIAAAILGLLICLRWRTAGSVITATAVATLYLLSTPLVASALVSALNDAGPLQRESARSAQAIVVLGAGVTSDRTELSGVTLGALTFERVRYAARLSREMQLPLAVSGGAGGGGATGLTEADLMRRALHDDYGMQVRWFEAKSRNTRENAVFTADVLRRDAVTTVLLITHPFDVRRARNEFVAAGLAVISAPAQVPFPEEVSGQALLPSMWALLNSHFATYEVLALIKASFQ